jgi:hypothetical protein
MTILRKTFATMGLTVVAAGAMVLPASASPASSSPAAAPKLETVNCYDVNADSARWSAMCSINPGQARAYTVCSNGVTYYGAWIGPGGPWRFGGECPFPETLVEFGYQERG